MEEPISPYFNWTDCPLCNSSQNRVLLELTYGDLKQKKSLDYKPIGIGGKSPFVVLKCRNCSFVYANPRIRPEFEGMVYNECKPGMNENSHSAIQNARIADRKRRFAYLGPLLEATSFLPQEKPEWRLFDFGCGYGQILALAKYLNVDAYGVDIDEERLNSCRDQGFKVSKPDEFSSFFPDFKADVVMWMSNIEHLLNPRAAAQYIADKCSPGAVVYIDGLKPRIIDIERRKGVYTRAHFIEHINYFPIRTLDKFLCEFGFKPLPKRSWVMVDSFQFGLERALIALIFKFIKDNPLSGHFARLYRFDSGSN